MNRTQAVRRYEALLRMTVARGCTQSEAATAKEIARRIAELWGLDSCATGSPAYRKTYAGDRVAQDERQAAKKYGWEYRRCGKRSCWCAGRPIRETHGPYRYAKQRRGRYVYSIYQGRSQ